MDELYVAGIRTPEVALYQLQGLQDSQTLMQEDWVNIADLINAVASRYAPRKVGRFDNDPGSEEERRRAIGKVVREWLIGG